MGKARLHNRSCTRIASCVPAPRSRRGTKGRGPAILLRERLREVTATEGAFQEEVRAPIGEE